MKSATISDVASLAGVSKSTVSAVLNNKTVVKDSTRRLVLRAIEELNYRPSPSARRGFRAAAGRRVHVVIKESLNPFYAEALRGIQDVADEKGYLVTASTSEGRYEMEQRIVRLCTEQETDGLIIAPVLNHDTDLSHIYELKRNGVPFVLLEAIRGIGANLIEVDNVKLSTQAVSYLIEQGHSRIVHFAGPPYSQHSQERSEGVRRAFSESHLVFDDSMLVCAGASLEEGYHAGLEFFRGRRSADRPTAATCYNDLVAIGLMRALRELGIDVPQDVSVVGFDDLKILEYLPLPLTTVHVPKYEMGRRAAEMVIRQIEAKGDFPAERVFLDARLVIRQSTRSLRSEPQLAAS
jgi:LacI family transcriptional regulator